MRNSFGHLFRITTWGESHGKSVGVVVDGCPPRIAISKADIQAALDRRKPGQSKITTPRKERDEIDIHSGIFEGLSTGTPIAMMVHNKDAMSKAYDHLKDLYRPSHADYTYDKKFGIRDYRGGGRASARETVGRVAAGVIAQKILKKAHDVQIISYVEKIHRLRASIDQDKLSAEQVDANIVRCPDEKTAKKMIQRIEKARKEGDSLGGIIRCVIKNVPAGLGEPVFGKLKADLSAAMLSIPATMGIQFGSGFGGTDLTGIEHNDAFAMDGNKVKTKTNRSGGIQGGISNGQDIYFQVAFKPTATINKKQSTVDKDGKATTLEAKGRHDPCVLPRAVPIVDAMAALVLVDHYLIQNSRDLVH